MQISEQNQRTTRPPCASTNTLDIMKWMDGRFGLAFRAVRNAKRHLKPLLTAAGLIALLIIFYVSWPDIVAAVRSNPKQFLILILLNFLIYWIQSNTFSQLMEPGRNFPKLFFVWGASNLLNYVTAFHAGLLLRGKYFINYNYTAKEIATKTVALMGVNTAVAIAFLLASISSNYWPAFVIGATIIIYYLSHNGQAIDKLSPWKKYLVEYLTVRILLLSAANNCVLVISIYSTLPIFGIEIDLRKAIQVASSLSLSSIISLMPNNIGVQEGIFVAFSKGETGAANAISASAFFRAASITAGLALVIAQGKFIFNLIRGH